MNELKRKRDIGVAKDAGEHNIPNTYNMGGYLTPIHEGSSAQKADLFLESIGGSIRGASALNLPLKGIISDRQFEPEEDKNA